MELWLIYAILAAVFAGATAGLVKIGIEGVNSHLATAIRSVVIVVFAFSIVLISGSYVELGDVSTRTWVFLILSGLATGGSWLCFFYALKFGTVSNVSPLKKSSTILTILLAFFILGEPAGIPQWIGILLIAAGTILMLKKKDGSKGKDEGGGNWLLFGILAAVFASLQSILGAIGIADVDANLGNAIRVVVVLFAAWGMVFLTGKQKGIKDINAKSWVFLILSGLATGGSWLFFFHALQLGNASAVVPIDKLSILLNIFFARIF